MAASASSSANIEIGNEVEEYFSSLPAGCRFCPSDAELIIHYLLKKVTNQMLPLNQIHELNIYNYNPDELAVRRQPAVGTKKWYFFTPRNRRCQNGKLPDRTAGDGFWKASVGDNAVIYQGRTVGFKKTLVFYRGRTRRGTKTNWIMQEFTLRNAPRKEPNDMMRLDDWVLCKLYKKEERYLYDNFMPTEHVHVDPVHPADNNLMYRPTDQVHPTVSNFISRPLDQVHPTESNLMLNPPDQVDPTESNLMLNPPDQVDPTESNLMSKPPDQVDPTESNLMSKPPDQVDPTESNLMSRHDLCSSVGSFSDMDRSFSDVDDLSSSRASFSDLHQSFRLDELSWDQSFRWDEFSWDDI